MVFITILLQLLFKIIRCKNKETLDNCVELTATRVKEGCKLLAAKNQISSSVFQNIRPSFACPIKKVSGIFESSFVLLIFFFREIILWLMVGLMLIVNLFLWTGIHIGRLLFPLLRNLEMQKSCVYVLKEV